MDKWIEESCNKEIEGGRFTTDDNVLGEMLEHVDKAQLQIDGIRQQLDSQSVGMGQKLLELGLVMNDLNGMIGNHHDAGSIANLVDKLLSGNISYDACAVMIVDDQEQASLAVIGKMLNDVMVGQVQRSLLEAMRALNGQNLSIKNRSITVRNIHAGLVCHDRFHSFCNVPMITEGKIWAMAHVASFEKDSFEAEQRQHFTSIVNQISQFEDSVESLVCCERKKLQAVIDNMTDGVVAWNKCGNIEVINPVARALLNLKDDCDPEEAKSVIVAIGVKEMFSECCIRQRGEFIGKSPANKVLQFKWATIHEGKDKQIAGKVVIIRDVTAQIELDRAQTEFIAAISHELRTPLTTIQNSVSNMLAGVIGKTSPKMQWYLNTMQSEGHRLAHLINDLLDMAKLEAGKMAVNRSSVNLIEIADKALSGFKENAAKKSINIKCVSDNTMLRVFVDAARIKQVLENLLSNAVRYTPDYGSVRVKIFETCEEVVTVVEDNGIGIPHDRLGKIFNKFYQISRQAGAGYNGSGLGLSLSSEIVAIHGGKMWVESELGKGSKFFFSLPKTQPELVVRKHVEALALRSGKRGERFVVLALKLKTDSAYANIHSNAISSAMKEILAIAGQEAKTSDDLVMRTGEMEMVMVLGQTGKRYLKLLKYRLSKIISDALENSYCNDGSIMPMLGMSLFPNDSSNIEELVQKASTDVCRIG